MCVHLARDANGFPETGLGSGWIRRRTGQKQLGFRLQHTRQEKSLFGLIDDAERFVCTRQSPLPAAECAVRLRQQGQKPGYEQCRTGAPDVHRRLDVGQRSLGRARRH